MIEFIAVTSLVCAGVFVCTWEGMIFHKLVKIYDNITANLLASKKLPPFGKFLSFIRNTLFGCLYCMSSLWTVAVWCATGFPFRFYLLPFAAWAVCGCNAVVFSLIKETVPGYNPEE